MSEWYLFTGAASSDALATASSFLSIVNSNFRKYNPDADWMIEPISLDTTATASRTIGTTVMYYGMPSPPAYLLTNTSNSTYAAATSWSIAWFSTQTILDFLLKEAKLWGKL